MLAGKHSILALDPKTGYHGQKSAVEMLEIPKPEFPCSKAVLHGCHFDLFELASGGGESLIILAKKLLCLTSMQLTDQCL